MTKFDEALKTGVELFEAELFWEAVDHFKQMKNSFPSDPSLDDLYINIAVCYMRLGIYDEAEEYFLPVYEEKIGSGIFKEGGNDRGKTRSRAILGLIRIALARRDLDQVDKYHAQIGLDDSSGLKERGVEVLYREIADVEVRNFRSMNEV